MPQMRDRLRPSSDLWSRFWRSELILLAVVAVIGWLLGLHTVRDYSYALIMVGIALLIIEICEPAEPFTNVRSLVYQRGARDWEGLEAPVDQQRKQHPSGIDDRIPIEHFRDVLISVFPIVVGLIIQAVF